MGDDEGSFFNSVSTKLAPRVRKSNRSGHGMSSDAVTRLSDFDHLISANVRGEVVPDQVRIAPGTGVAGDLVLGLLHADPACPARVLNQKRELQFLSRPHHVVAALGLRIAPNSVSATLPVGGLDVSSGVVAHWVAGESGIVGCLDGTPAGRCGAPNEGNHPREFRLIGLLHDANDRKLSVRDFVIEPRAARLRRPVVLVGATSGELGKTVLAGQIIRHLSEQGLRVGAVKASGTGGTMDCTSHQQHGAVLALDQVDAGLSSTHGDPDEVATRLVTVLRRMEDAEVDVVVVELGGELLSAANPRIAHLPEIRGNAIGFAVISSDTLGAYGVRAFNEARLHYHPRVFRYFTSPFRNHAAMSCRMASVGFDQTWDPNSQEDIARLASELARAIRRRETVEARRWRAVRTDEPQRLRAPTNPAR